jgi:alpha-L-arabinofuranosidase
MRQPTVTSADITDRQSFLLKFFDENKSMIEAMAYKYNQYALDRAYEQNDFIQLAWLAIVEAAWKWDFNRGEAQFKSLLFRYLQKEFQGELTGKHKLVEITDRGGQLVDVLPWTVYQKKKRQYLAMGYSGTTISRMVPLFENEEARYASPDEPEHFGEAIDDSSSGTFNAIAS